MNEWIMVYLIHTVSKFTDFSTPQIFREISYCNSKNSNDTFADFCLKLVSRKICKAENSLNFPHCVHLGKCKEIDEFETILVHFY